MPAEMCTVMSGLMKLQGQTRTLTGKWTRGHLYYILAKNLAVFCPRPEISHQVNSKVTDDGVW